MPYSRTAAGPGPRRLHLRPGLKDRLLYVAYGEKRQEVGGFEAQVAGISTQEPARVYRRRQETEVLVLQCFQIAARDTDIPLHLFQCQPPGLTRTLEHLAQRGYQWLRAHERL